MTDPVSPAPPASRPIASLLASASRGNGAAHRTGGGATLASAGDEMEAFGELPAELQAALRASEENYSAVNVLARWKAAAGRYGEDRATRRGVQVIQESDAALLASMAATAAG